MPKVLFIEDTETMQRMYSIGLVHEGFEVTVTPTAGQALDKVEHEHFDIIVCDLMLTGMSGLDFLEASGVQTKSPDTLVVLSLIHISEPTRLGMISYAGFCLKK